MIHLKEKDYQKMVVKPDRDVVIGTKIRLLNTLGDIAIARLIKNPLPVLTKHDFVRRFQKGEFGNRGPTWNTLEEFIAADYEGLMCLRNQIAGGPLWYDVPADKVARVFKDVTEIDGIKPSDLYFSAMAPTERTLFQGEVMQSSENSLSLFYTHVRKPMRDALREHSSSVSGIIATRLLRQFLCPNSYAWLEVLLERYPDHVVEFSTYETNWGTLPNHNTITWEVRRY